MKRLAIFGAKSLALGAYRAIHTRYPEYEIIGFLVSTMHNNPSTLAGLPVMELQTFAEKDVWILIATPEDTHDEIKRMLEKYHFHCYICMDSKREARLMEQYYKSMEQFPALREDMPSLCVYMAKFHKDIPLQNDFLIPDWVVPIQVGAALTDVEMTELRDDLGENISSKNVNYCELTALYWMWKNRLRQKNRADYYGLFHYRRMLRIHETDLSELQKNDVDVVLPYPTLHEPDMSEHHARYMKEEDWQAMLSALCELQPEYAAAFPRILKQAYLYNYNIVIAKAGVLEDYCTWLFPILKRTEELSVPKGWERADRYIGYLGENLLTLYFMYHQKDLRICHTGRLMLT